ncbi:MAG TPA: hypothetical protein VGR40_04095, partial [Candidatus Binatus sp.]|nr:hypothetical protein [Candidatus Binatus sp.]
MVGRRWFELEPPIAERMGLETSPRLSTVANYVFTAAAQRAWETLNQHLEGLHGGVFWIGGPAGCGKTHFLNYVIALQKRAGALDTHNARRLVCGLELAGRIDGAEVELILLSVLAEQIGGDPRASDIFRQMRGTAALNVSLENARRMGIRAVTVAIDFATSSYDGTAEFFAMLSEVAASFLQLKFTVIAAGREAAPASVKPLQVAPRDNDELATIAVRRARRLIDDADSVANEAYEGIDTNGPPPSAIYPFHPRTLRVLTRIAANPDVNGDASEPATIVSLSRLVRSALDSPSILGGRDDSSTPLLYPPDLTANPTVSDRIKDHLSQSERAAWKIARDAADALDAHEKDLAREIVDTIVVEHAATVKLEELKTLVPTIAFASASNVQAVSLLPDLLRRLEISTGGAIRLDADTVRFDPEAAGAPELAAFNSALMLARRFDPRLTIARDRDSLAERLRRLDAAMANAVEAAAHTSEMLESTLREANLQPPAASIAAIARYIELAESGAHAMLGAAADRSRVESLLQTIDAYDALASAAAAIPRMRAMREYLVGTGLRALHEDSAPLERDARESGVTALETECELLQVELGPRVLTGPPRNLDALEARFQKFKWTYVQCYLSAHARWREKMARLNLV